MADAEGYYLTEEDRNALRELLDRELRGRRHGRSRYSLPEETSQSPDVYVAHIPPAGIPAIDVGVTTGTGSWNDDTPSSAECGIYRLVESGGTYDLKPIGITRKVYNIANSAVQGNIWAIVQRDKFGTWYTSVASSSFSGCRLHKFGSLIVTASLSIDYIFGDNAGSLVEAFDTDNYHLSPASRITVPASGYYLVGGSAYSVNGTLPSPFTTYLYIRKNRGTGPDDYVANALMNSYVDATQAASISALVFLQTGDFVELGFTPHLTSGSPYVGGQTYDYVFNYVSFWIIKLGT